MTKPSIKMVWYGLKGNKFRKWIVTVDGKKYIHQSKSKAHSQYKSALRFYNKTK